MLSHWAGSSPIGAAVQALFAAGEPGAVFIAQKPSDLLVRRNQLTYSEDFANSAWLVFGAGCTKVGAGPVAPNGATSQEIALGSVGGAINGAGALFQSLSINPTVAGKTYAAGFYVRSKTGSTTIRSSITWGGATTTGSADITVTDTDWTWVPVSAIAPLYGAGANPNVALRNNVAGNSGNVYVAAAQIVVGSVADGTTYQKVTDWLTEYLAAAGDAITQYVDNLGVTPVTDLEQTVGLHLDTRPVILGPELVFGGATTVAVSDNTTTNVTNTSFTQSGGVTATNSYVPLNNLRIGATYRTSARVAAISGGIETMLVRANSIGGGAVLSNLGSVVTAGVSFPTTQFVATATAHSLVLGNTSPGTSNTIDRVTVREVISASNSVGQPLRGPQLVSNGSFANGSTGWSVGGTTTVGGGVAATAGTGAFALIVQQSSVPVVSGGWYEYTITVAATSGVVAFQSGANNIRTSLPTGTFRGLWQAPGSASVLGVIEGSGGTFVGSVTGFSLKLVYGNHRSQSSAPARARLSARYNKVTARNANPVDLTGVTFTNCANALGTLSVVSDTAALAAAGLSGKCTLGNVYKLDNTLGNGTIFADFAGTAGNTNSQVLSGSIRGTGTGMLTINALAPSFTALTAGYAPITITQTPAASGNDLQIRASTGSIVYFILPDMREACYSYLPTPQVVWDATTGYDDTGFPARLVYSGAQGYATGAIDFSGSAQAQSWYGMAKLADAAAGIAIELSADGGTNAGTFTFYSNTGNYVGRVFGGGAVNDRAGTPYSAPSANVASATYDLSAGTAAGQVALRVNGAVPTTTAGTLTTTGLLGNYPAYFGSRAGTGVTLPLTGDEFISIVRGGATPDANTISYVERFCARYPALTF